MAGHNRKIGTLMFEIPLELRQLFVELVDRSGGDTPAVIDRVIYSGIQVEILRARWFVAIRKMTGIQREVAWMMLEGMNFGEITRRRGKKSRYGTRDIGLRAEGLLGCASREDLIKTFGILDVVIPKSERS